MRIGKFNTADIVDGYRLIKAFVRSRRDAYLNNECAPWGIDSHGLDGTDVVQCPTGNDETTLVLGYIQRNRKARPGEARIFATNGNGEVVIDAWFKNDGTAEIGGEDDNFVRYSELEKAFNELNEKFNTLVQTFNAHSHPTAPSGPISPPQVVPPLPTTPIPAEQSDADIEPARIDNLKTSSNGS